MISLESPITSKSRHSRKLKKSKSKAQSSRHSIKDHLHSQKSVNFKKKSEKSNLISKTKHIQQINHNNVNKKQTKNINLNNKQNEKMNINYDNNNIKTSARRRNQIITRKQRNNLLEAESAEAVYATPQTLPLVKSRKKKNSKRKSQKGCRCTKSKCLRLHCVCFGLKIFCGPECGCKGCYNTKDNEQLVNDVRKATKDINSQAFESRFMEIKVGNEIKRITKGCSCSKNNCQKNYCICFKYGMPCTSLCKCNECCNESINIEPKKASKLLNRTSRKKKKIVFVTKGNNALEMTEEVLISKHKM